MIVLKHCLIERADDKAITMFKDGSVSVSSPSPQEYYPGIWADVGCPDDPVRYNFEHEFIHSFLAEKMWDSTSYVVWMDAHDKRMSTVGAKFEERWCWHFHRFLNDTGPALEPEWHIWKLEAKGLLALEYGS